MKILTTGGTGYIGSHVVVELLNQGYEVEILDNLSNSKIAVLDQIKKITGQKPKFHQVDLCDFKATEKVFENGNFDLIIHFAGLKSVNESVEKPLAYYDNNLAGTINLLKLAQKYDARNFIFSSSATVYGTQETPECFENMETGRGITNPYGQTKFMIEQILKDLAVAWPEFSCVCLRYFNPVGNHSSGLLGENPNGIPNNLMPYIMKVAKGELKELSIFGNDYDTPDGTCRRDYIHVVDLAKGHLAAIKVLTSEKQSAPINQTTPANQLASTDKSLPNFHVYNLGTGQPTSVLEMVETFEKVSGRPLPHKFAARRAGDLPETWANADKAKRELNWQTELTIKDAIRDTLTFISKN